MRAPFVLLAAACLAALVMASTALTSRPATVSRRLRHVAFWFGAVTLSVLALVAASDAMTDPGGWGGAALIAAWLAPVAALVVLTRVAPRAASVLLVITTAALLAFCVSYAFEPSTWSGIESERGAARSTAMLALTTALLAHGLRRAELAGLLMLLTGALPVALAAFTSRASTALLVASTPAIIVGTIYLGSSLLAERRDRPAHATRDRFGQRPRAR
jgi:hypothetical protein